MSFHVQIITLYILSSEQNSIVDNGIQALYIYIYILDCNPDVYLQGDGPTFNAKQHWKSEIGSVATFSSEQ